jgi:ABC-type uncharacterized transport system substrate-binding protein
MVGTTQLIAGYRLNAANCFDLAKEFADPERKLALLDMATAWALQAQTHTVRLIGMTEHMVAAGFVKSLASPGGNITGISLLSPELDGNAKIS